MIRDDEHLSFIKHRIEEIKIASFKAEIDSILTLPNNIISTLKVDEEGFVWFYTYCNETYAQQVDKEFYVTLEYYQKSTNTLLRIGGKASIVEGDDHVDASVKSPTVTSSLLLLKLKIMHAEYNQCGTAKASWIQKIKTKVADLFLLDQEQKFDFR